MKGTVWHKNWPKRWRRQYQKVNHKSRAPYHSRSDRRQWQDAEDARRDVW